MIKLLAILFILLSWSAVAQPIDIDAIAKQPGTEIIKRSDNGSEIIEIRRGGVVATVKNGQLTSAYDLSGHGAIWCVWMIYVEMKVAIDRCFPGQFDELSDLLTDQIEAMNEFIVANSLTPVTKADQQKMYEAQVSRSHIRAGSNACHSIRRDFIDQFEAQLRTDGYAALKRKFEQTLAVPRPPVMNPLSLAKSSEHHRWPPPPGRHPTNNQAPVRGVGGLEPPTLATPCPAGHNRC
jgi:hypothetical protein